MRCRPTCAAASPSSEARRRPSRDWAPLRFTFAGVWEIQPHWLEEILGKVQVVDVREPDEFTGPLGHIRGATLSRWASWRRAPASCASDKPIVAVCRAGARSAQATAILQKAGFADVANLPGGMLRWRAARGGRRWMSGPPPLEKCPSGGPRTVLSGAGRLYNPLLALASVEC